MLLCVRTGKQGAQKPRAQKNKKRRAKKNKKQKAQKPRMQNKGRRAKKNKKRRQRGKCTIGETVGEVTIAYKPYMHMFMWE